MARPGRPAKYPYLMEQGGIQHARVQIPVAVRVVFGGKSVFMRSTHLSDDEAAYRRAEPWIIQWRAEIDAARAGRPLKSAEEIASDFLASVGQEADFKLLSTISRVIAAHRLGISADKLRQTGAADGDPVEALITLSGQEAIDQLRQHTEARKPFISRVDDWKVWLTRATAHRAAVEQGSVYQYGQSLKAFACAHDTAIETIGPADLQAYVDARAAAGTGRATMQRDLGAVKSYLRFLAETDGRVKALLPQFESVRAPLDPKRARIDPNTPGFEVKIEGRHDITPADVVKLWKAADELDQIDARDCIAIQAFTGARRESVFCLHVKTVFADDPVPWLFFWDKTEAGERRVPIHPDIMPMIRARLANASANDGYLFRGSAENKRGSRSGRINNPMRGVFDHAGVITDEDVTTKAFRRLVSGMLERARVPESIAAKFIGHKLKTMTYGLYAGDLPMPEKHAIMLDVLNYPQRLSVRTDDAGSG